MAGGEHVYATLLLSDSYLPGALVLAHSLRDARTTKKLAVLVTLDSVSSDAVTQLKAVYDYVLPVPRIRNAQPSNLYLMNRGDLHSAFTKVNLWKQLQFSKIVYIDSDVVAYRAPDELFSTPHAFAAAPDIGWPDLFNTGVMVLTPNMGDYYAMMAMAERGISFDGADQGLLNMHFKNSYHRISFTYNVTPSAHYQYIPAYRHFQSSINMVHFIGANKPWFAGRNAPHGSSPFDEMVGRWWAVYDRHYRKHEAASPGEAGSGTAYVQYFTKGEFQPQAAAPPSPTFEDQHQHRGGPSYHGDSAHTGGTGTFDFPSHASSSFTVAAARETQADARSEQQVIPPSPAPVSPPRQKPEPTPTPIALSSWDAQRQPPPTDSKPEAMNFPSTHYAMSQDSAPFVPPVRYPSPPRNMWYEVPKEPPAPSGQPPKPVFPWEGHQPRPSRSFAGTAPEPIRSKPFVEPQGAPQVAGGSRSLAEPSMTASTSEGTGTGVESPAPSSSTTAKVKPRLSEAWTSFQLSNAWDDVPEIGRYVEGLQKHRRGKSQGSPVDVASPLGVGSPRGGQRSHGLRLTDFPSETERPSLPVTPAPIARPSFWGDDEADAPEFEHHEGLPAAEGVPAQAEWDPGAQLQKLARQQYEQVLRRLQGEQQGEGSTSLGRIIPQRSLPFGSEDSRPSTYTGQSGPDISLPKPVEPESPSTAASVPRQASAAPGAASPAKDEPTHSGSRSPEAKDDGGSQLLGSPMPRIGDE